jgi:hypothetical protein
VADQDLREKQRRAAGGDPEHEAALLAARARAGSRSATQILAYVRTLEGVELPTDEQTRAFIEWVASAHSWYKHLRRPAPFWFHLDAHAGLSRAHESDPPSFSEVTVKHRFHHNFRTTRQWREQFGAWVYRLGEPTPALEKERARSVWDGERWIPVPSEFGGPAIADRDLHGSRFERAGKPTSDERYEQARANGLKQIQAMFKAATSFREAVRRAREAI